MWILRWGIDKGVDKFLPEVETSAHDGLSSLDRPTVMFGWFWRRERRQAALQQRSRVG
jgi:hypothetical protein